MILVHSFYRGDFKEAARFFDFCRELDGVSDHSVLLVSEKDMPDADREVVVTAAKAAFNLVGFVMPTESVPPNWHGSRASALGPNLQFQAAARYIASHHPKESWLWTEPDCVPMAPGWIRQIESAYQHAGKAFMGTLRPNPTPQLNGVAVYPPNVERINPRMVSERNMPFDCVDVDKTLASFHQTALIQRLTNNNGPCTFPTEESIRQMIAPGCVLFHGCLDGSLNDRIRESAIEAQAPSQKPLQLVILGLCKGCDATIDGLLSSMDGLLAKLPEWGGVFCVDKLGSYASGRILAWAKNKKRPVRIFEEPHSLPTKDRYRKMAVLRNACLLKMEQSKFEPDMILWIDMDIAGFASWEGVEVLKTSAEWDGAAVLGLMPRSDVGYFDQSTEINFDGKTYCYYDLLALESLKRERVLWRHPGTPAWYSHGITPAGVSFSDKCPIKFGVADDLVGVNSAFGPACFYRWSVVKGMFYDTATMQCEHQEFHARMRKDGRKIFLNTQIIALYSDPWKQCLKGSILGQFSRRAKSLWRAAFQREDMPVIPPYNLPKSNPFHLPTVTLFSIDAANPTRALNSLHFSCRWIRFAEVVLLTDTDRFPNLPDGLYYDSVKVPVRIVHHKQGDAKWQPPRPEHYPVFVDYERASLVEPAAHVKTPHLLFQEWDSAVVNPMAWDATWLQYDFIGAPWMTHGEPGWPTCDGATNAVGNFGFSLRSLKFCELTRELASTFKDDPGLGICDMGVCLTHREWMEDRGIKFAPVEVAMHFSCENRIYAGSFGFHGAWTAQMNGWGGSFFESVAKNVK